MKRLIFISALLLFFSPAFAAEEHDHPPVGPPPPCRAPIPYNATTWENSTCYPTAGAVRDKIETMAGGHDAVTLAASLTSILGISAGQELSADTQTANYVLAGPTAGGAAAPAFRALVADDIPDLSGTYLAAETDPTALLTAGTDNVKDTHIDWGTGATQVSGGDVPLDVTNFDGNLSATDVDVQTALETLDEMSGGVTVNDTPTDGETTVAASSNSVYDHINGSLHAWVVGATSVLALASPIVLDEATGNEYAQSLFYQTNKASSGSDTGQIISMRDTASPGTSYLFRAGVNTDGTVGTHVDKFYITPTGGVTASSNISSGGFFNSTISDTITYAAYIYNQTVAATGNQKIVNIAPTYNQASGTAANTDILINRTETAVGSGAQKLIEGQVATVPKFTVWNTGGVTVGKYTSDPCPTIGEGSIFYNDTGNYMCYCNGTDDVKMSDDSTACF
ncbi:MAG TPA: hypothetical protein DCZ63_09115 [Geobacter sp.]|nr:hypothetical protein [Geobacter sp.]